MSTLPSMLERDQHQTLRIGACFTTQRKETSAGCSAADPMFEVTIEDAFGLILEVAR